MVTLSTVANNNITIELTAVDLVGVGFEIKLISAFVFKILISSTFEAFGPLYNPSEGIQLAF